MPQNPNDRPSLSAGVATALPVAAVLALLVIGARCIAVRGALANAQKADAVAQDSSAESLLRGFSLPVNRPLRFCNESGEPVRITSLAAMHWSQDGNVGNFNSAEHGWLEWTLARGQSEILRDNSAAGTWDGSAIFYVAEIQAGSDVSLLAGTSDGLKDGSCIVIHREGGRLATAR